MTILSLILHAPQLLTSVMVFHWTLSPLEIQRVLRKSSQLALDTTIHRDKLSKYVLNMEPKSQLLLNYKMHKVRVRIGALVPGYLIQITQCIQLQPLLEGGVEMEELVLCHGILVVWQV